MPPGAALAEPLPMHDDKQIGAAAVAGARIIWKSQGRPRLIVAMGACLSTRMSTSTPYEQGTGR